MREAVVLLLLFFAPVVFVPRSGDAFEPPRAFLQGTAMAVLVAVGLSGVLRRHGWLPAEGPSQRLAIRIVAWARSDPLSASVLLFLVSSAVSTAFSIRPTLSLFGYSAQPAGLVTALATASVFFAARADGGTLRFLLGIARAASLAAAVAAAYALIQFAGLDPLPWVWTATLGEVVRVPGTLGHPNHLGTYLALTLPLIVLLIRCARSRAEKGAWLLLAGVAVFVIGITLSRGAWLAVVAGAAAYALVSLWSRGATRGAAGTGAGHRRRLHPLAWAGAALVVFLLPLLTPMGADFLHRLRQVTDLNAPTTKTRLLLWSCGLRMFGDHPWTGVGTDAFVAAYPLYRTPEFMRLEWASTSVRAHNEPIQIGATQGLLGLLAALLVASFAIRAVLRLGRAPDSALRAAAAPVSAALVAWAVSGLSSFTVIATGTLAAVLGGWLAGCSATKGAPAARPEARGAATPRSWLLAGFIAAVMWVPLVLLPWLASDAASRGIGLPPGNPERAPALRRAAAIAPWDARYALELGRTLLARAYTARGPGQVEESLRQAAVALDHAVRIAPEDGEGRALLALAHAGEASVRADRVRAAQVDLELRRVLDADSTTATVLDLVTAAYLDIGLYAPAHAVAIHCARLYPAHAQPMADVGRILLGARQYGDAVDTLALALDRNWHGNSDAEAKAHYGRAFALLQLGRAREAWEETGRALDLSPTLGVARSFREEAARAMKTVADSSGAATR